MKLRNRNIRQCAILLCCIVLVALISSRYSFRIDLTAEKRYTLSPETKQVLRELDAPLYADIFLDGDLPPQFRRFRNVIREMFSDFKTFSSSRLIVRFVDPSDAENRQEREERYAHLEEAGLRKISLNRTAADGSQSQQTVFPGAILSYKDRQAPVNLLSNSRTSHYETILNASQEALEYELVKTISMLHTDSIERVAFITGHGELIRAETWDVASEFANFYHVDRKTIDGNPKTLDNYRAIIIAAPENTFSEADKFAIDRYLMRGGRIMWLLDGVSVNTDSLATAGITFALARELNLDDMLFTYGVRVNPVVVQDIDAHIIPVTTDAQPPQTVAAPWLYYPLAQIATPHAITRNLDPVWLRYASDLDTVGRDPSIRKTVLLRSSDLSRTRAVPFLISLGEVEQMPDRQQFNRPHRMLAILLEGQFPSVFRSRNARSLIPGWQEKQIEQSIETRMLVVADGDIARNDIRQTIDGIMPVGAVGLDRFTNTTFANRDFLVNALNYLTDDAGLMTLRNRELKLRLLNRQKAIDERRKWQFINLAIPLLLLSVGGLAWNNWRRYHYGSVKFDTGSPSIP